MLRNVLGRHLPRADEGGAERGAGQAGASRVRSTGEDIRTDGTRP